ncbi:MAG TPA: hypothetical protein P5056_03490 [Candidatus Paceibacterota bacterium]|nr:hypothetical protein [Candidatus Paceibacterota bacterium]
MTIFYVVAASLVGLLITFCKFRGVTIGNIIARSEAVLEEYADDNENKIHEHALIVRNPNDKSRDARAIIVSESDLAELLLKKIFIGLSLLFPAFTQLFYFCGGTSLGVTGSVFMSLIMSTMVSIFSVAILNKFSRFHPLCFREESLSYIAFGPKFSKGVSTILLDAAEYELKKYDEEEAEEKAIAEMPENTAEEKKAKAIAEVKLKIKKIPFPKNRTIFG